MTPRLTLSVCALSLLGCAPDPVADVVPGAELVQQAWQRIAAYHEGQPRGGAVLRVVYFHPNDRDPLPHYAERLDRALNDVSDFYRDGFKRFGVSASGLPLERENGKVKLHLVRGKHEANAYSYESGSDTREEVAAAMKSVFDIKREHVLVIYGLCRKEADGRYVFHAPYYGSGNVWNGVCHAADCELLDPKLLTDKDTQMVFTEHYYPRVQKSVAGFNSMYLGGLAHELGHGLGLFHDAGMNSEQGQGTSLMGGGNLVYRNELHSGKNPAFLACVSALHLASHPFLTGSNHGRWDKLGARDVDLSLKPESKGIRITGKTVANIPAYAVVAYAWPRNATDHSAITFPALTKEDGSFDLFVKDLKPDQYFMRIVSLHLNGAFAWNDYHFEFDAPGTATKPVRFNWPWIVNQAEKAVLNGELQSRRLLADDEIAKASPADQRRLRVLRTVLDPAPVRDFAKVEDQIAWLSDVSWREASVGWGQITRNHYWMGGQEKVGVFLAIGGQVFEKGLYAHAPSRFFYELGGRWKSLSATVGLRDGAPGFGSAVFRVVGDGKELYRSPVLRVGQREIVEVDVAGVKVIELLAEGGDGNNHGSWAIWADPQVTR